jgi:putative YphP/YqiW family bacilliredoxin
MMYPEPMVKPMRDELTQLGIQELRTAAAVAEALGNAKGTALVVVNSVCGCSARNARPAVAMAMQHAVKPDASYTVFAGQDIDATKAARAFFAGYPPSSPSIALLKDGQIVTMLERHHIESRTAAEIAVDLVRAFDRHCAAAATR